MTTIANCNQSINPKVGSHQRNGGSHRGWAIIESELPPRTSRLSLLSPLLVRSPILHSGFFNLILFCVNIVPSFILNSWDSFVNFLQSNNAVRIIHLHVHICNNTSIVHVKEVTFVCMLELILGNLVSPHVGDIAIAIALVYPSTALTVLASCCNIFFFFTVYELKLAFLSNSFIQIFNNIFMMSFILSLFPFSLYFWVYHLHPWFLHPMI